MPFYTPGEITPSGGGDDRFLSSNQRTENTPNKNSSSAGSSRGVAGAGSSSSISSGGALGDRNSARQNSIGSGHQMNSGTSGGGGAHREGVPPRRRLFNPSSLLSVIPFINGKSSKSPMAGGSGSGTASNVRSPIAKQQRLSVTQEKGSNSSTSARSSISHPHQPAPKGSAASKSNSVLNRKSSKGGGGGSGGGGAAEDVEASLVADKDAREKDWVAARDIAFKSALIKDPADLNELRQLCWHGCLPERRYEVWRILCGQLQAEKAQRKTVLRRKRREYAMLVASNHANVNWPALTEQQQTHPHQSQRALATAQLQRARHEGILSPSAERGLLSPSVGEVTSLASPDSTRSAGEPAGQRATLSPQAEEQCSAERLSGNRAERHIDAEKMLNNDSLAVAAQTRDTGNTDASLTANSTAVYPSLSLSPSNENNENSEVVATAANISAGVRGPLLSSPTDSGPLIMLTNTLAESFSDSTATSPCTSSVRTKENFPRQLRDVGSPSSSLLSPSSHTITAPTGVTSPANVASSSLSVGVMELQIMKQIKKDVPRMSGGVPFLLHPRVQLTVERVLFIWALRHPACGYVQGMNDLVLPFLSVVLAAHFCTSKTTEELYKWTAEEVAAAFDCPPTSNSIPIMKLFGKEHSPELRRKSPSHSSAAALNPTLVSPLSSSGALGTSSSSSSMKRSSLRPAALSPLSGSMNKKPIVAMNEEEWLTVVEADVYWLASYFLNSVQENYTYNQSGLFAMVKMLESIIKTIDPALHQHLKSFQIEFAQFAFRWMNCFLMREFSSQQALRLWDSYLADETREWNAMHVYVCAALMKRLSPALIAELDYSVLMKLLQNPSTNGFTMRDMDELISDGFLMQQLYQNTPSRLQGS